MSLNEAEVLEIKARINQYIAHMQAIEAEKVAMTVANVLRMEQGKALAYNEEDFQDVAGRLYGIAMMLNKIACRMEEKKDG